jgi:hypothetical protein
MICFVHKTVSLKIFDKREKYGVKILPHEYMACSRSLHWINNLKRAKPRKMHVLFIPSFEKKIRTTRAPSKPGMYSCDQQGQTVTIIHGASEMLLMVMF